MNKNDEKSKVQLPKRETAQASRFEKIGYKLANKVHKLAVFSIVSFIAFNIFLFGKEYNDHWKARRVIFI
jgi:hypothetical protein